MWKGPKYVAHIGPVVAEHWMRLKPCPRVTQTLEVDDHDYRQLVDERGTRHTILVGTEHIYIRGARPTRLGAPEAPSRVPLDWKKAGAS